ncbi:YezD family protein [Geomonas anaerohicana]|uniref:YezD family protein n=1 Tax=Geomonas anaerohicana TaxID=2798583 RepID=A0ABS0YB30_9BACT|nr:YezD family protein [Geomonas anaerohicana]MBJ6749481.1 YezD family protein [Geomonas anaerohicana]
METTSEQSGKLSSDLEQRIRLALRDLRYGTVTLVVQDGKVIQLDKNEKIRIQ